MAPRHPLLHAARIADAILFWPLLLLVVWGEIAGPGDGSWLSQINDKVLHFLAYFALAAMAAAAFKGRKGVVLAVLALIVLGGILEIIQGMVGRDMSIYDEMANTAGALIGGMIARAIVEPLRNRFAAW